MGQKANPIGNRLGIIRGWESNWFATKDYGLKVVEDEKIRQYLKARKPKTVSERGERGSKGVNNGISKVTIERSLKRITVTIQTARPGLIIGRKGEEVELMRQELKVLTGKETQVNIFEVRKPELDAAMVGEQIAKQIEGRVGHRRAIKAAIQATIRTGGEGIKVRISGRLGGAEMSRTEEYKEGRTPLHTFRADIDYALSEAQTVYGKIGIKVWIFKGEVLTKRDLTPFSASEIQGASEDRRGGGDFNNNRDRGGDRRGGGDRDRRGGGGDRRGGSGGDNRGGGGDRRGGGGGDRRGGGGGVRK